MSTLKKMSRRSLIRTVSFTVALIVALAASSISAFAAARAYRTTVEYSYQRALSQLSEYINNLNTTLEKGQYASTSKQIQGLSTKLWQDSGYAKTAISQLPVSINEIGTTNKFLSQVGNFCIALSDRVSSGGTISDEELETLDRLSEYASSISEQLRKMVSDIENGSLRIGEVSKTVKNNMDKQDTPDIANGFREIEDGFTDYPSMIYDGPFSDHIQQQKPKLLQGQAQVSVDRAIQVAKKVTGASNLKHAGDSNGNLPCYEFTDGSVRASVTKAGGLLNYFLNSRSVGEPKITNENAIKLAHKALTDMGMNNFEYRYFAINNGILVVNFAATQNGTILYPDLVKVGIALDDGSLMSYDAKGYIMNHQQRDLPEIVVSEDEARDNLSKRLSVVAQDLALVPSDGLTESLCYEFSCRGDDDEQVLVYVNVENGMEEQILIIIDDESGVLAI